MEKRAREGEKGVSSKDGEQQHDIEMGLEVKMSLQYTRTKEISLYE